MPSKKLLLGLSVSLAMMFPATPAGTWASLPLAGGRGLFHQSCQPASASGSPRVSHSLCLFSPNGRNTFPDVPQTSFMTSTAPRDFGGV